MSGRWCRNQSTGVPITFLLGFYVSLVVKRWWEQYCKLPWPDTIAIYLKGLVQGKLGHKRIIARLVRRTVMRWEIFLITLKELHPVLSSDTVFSPTFSVSDDSHQDWKNDFLTWRFSLLFSSGHCYIFSSIYCRSWLKQE